MVEYHPLADAFPMIEGAEFGELVADIDNNGLLNPIVMFEGKILDGRNRHKACQRLQIPHTEKQFTGDDPAAFVWSVNAVRRQLTASQKAMAATKLVTTKRGDNQYTDRSGDRTTVDEAATMAGVGEKTVRRAKVVIDKAIPEVQKAVQAGEVSVYTAERIAQMPVTDQEEIMSTTDVADLPSRVPESPNLRRAAVPTDFVAPVEEPKGPGRGYVGPATQLARQLEAYSPEGAKLRAKMWAEHRELIMQLDTGMVEQFVKDLRAERRAIEQLIKLIKIEQDRTAAVAEQGTES
jgi:hypothetical protein